jgi:hypothetical protein
MNRLAHLVDAVVMTHSWNITRGVLGRLVVFHRSRPVPSKVLPIPRDTSRGVRLVPIVSVHEIGHLLPVGI